MSKYKKYSKDQVEELLSNYLIESWSYSKVREFSRNEKTFEMHYIYGEDTRYSATAAAGQAYHAGLCLYFSNKKAGINTDIVSLEQMAFSYIDGISADRWKLQKTTPTVQECINTATKSATQFLNNFMAGIEVYEQEIEEVIATELKLKSWVTVNGVDIPLPLSLVIDLIVRTKSGKLVIIDHKSKRSFTDDDELRFSVGKQAITYVLGYESETGETVDEVWFIENKLSKSRDASPQLLPVRIQMDGNTRKLYEAMLYEPLRRMIQAVSDPDYVYVMNDDDNLTDKAEMYNFWAKTMIAELDDFNIANNKKPLIKERLRKIRDTTLATTNPQVLKNFRKYSEQFISYDIANKDMTQQEKIEHVLRAFGVIAKVQHIFQGYSSVTYLLEVGAGVSVSSVMKYRLDIANALNVPNVRIEKDLFVYEDKAYLSIESSRKDSGILGWDKNKLARNMIPLGIDNFQRTIYWNLDNPSTPHMLVCGATGSGKSVFLRSTIEFCLANGIDDIYIFDPKYEFRTYNSASGVTVINDISDIETQIGLLTLEMEDRVKSQSQRTTLIVFDEFADAVANSRRGNELNNYGEEVTGYYKSGAPKVKRVVKSVDRSLEENLRILLQKGRSSGFRIIAATQRASTKVITGDAKVNFPVQVCFRVPKEIDSIVVLDEPGAEALNGKGDGLIKSPDYFGVTRFQAFYHS